jgi:hypothetical protein
MMIMFRKSSPSGDGSDKLNLGRSVKPSFNVCFQLNDIVYYQEGKLIMSIHLQHLRKPWKSSFMTADNLLKIQITQSLNKSHKHHHSSDFLSAALSLDYVVMNSRNISYMLTCIYSFIQRI